MANYDKVKIVVVGDSGVGKTSAVHLMCRNMPLTNPSWTVGCSVEVKLHVFKEGTPQSKTYFIDFWDVGGSASHQNARSVFYNGVNGIVLVHDLNNRKSEVNLQKWLMEILNRDFHNGNASGANSPSSSVLIEEEFDPEQFVGSSQIPIFVIGCKSDSAEDLRHRSSRASSIAEECGADEIFINCQDVRSIAPGSTAAVKLSRFFDKVIERRFYREHSNSFYERRKMYPSSTRLFGDD